MPGLRHTQPSAARETMNPIHLTRRELEILTLITEGKPSQQVADQLFISRRTVDFHLENIYQKLEVSNRAQAFFEAARRGLMSFPAVSAKSRRH